jgi:hypothetical protein
MLGFPQDREKGEGDRRVRALEAQGLAGEGKGRAGEAFLLRGPFRAHPLAVSLEREASRGQRMLLAAAAAISQQGSGVPGFRSLLTTGDRLRLPRHRTLR